MDRFFVLIVAVSFFTAFGASAKSNKVDLLAYMNANVQTPPSGSSVEKYNRAKHFGGWAHQDPNKTCADTREMVLERSEDQRVPIKFSNNGCSIVSGLWHEPYTDSDIRQASELQIDHVVPLRATYYAGAYAWSPAERCNYANYIGNDFHLLAVNGHENMSKGDRGPDQYLPPNNAERCAYVSSWMKIKAIWQLSTTRQEIKAIEKVLRDENCAASDASMDADELADQRQQAIEPISACVKFGVSE